MIEAVAGSSSEDPVTEDASTEDVSDESEPESSDPVSEDADELLDESVAVAEEEDDVTEAVDESSEPDDPSSDEEDELEESESPESPELEPELLLLLSVDSAVADEVVLVGVPPRSADTVIGPPE